jgi:hypothetical protein
MGTSAARLPRGRLRRRENGGGLRPRAARGWHPTAANGLGAGPAAGGVAPVVIPRLVKLASRRGGAWRECRAASMDALVAAALSTEGRRRLSAPRGEDLPATRRGG